MVIPALVALVSFGQVNAGTIAGGKFQTSNGVRVELIGFANSDTRMGPVYGADGKPLGKAGVQEFVKYSEEPSFGQSAAYRQAPRRWFAIFRLVGPDEETRQVRFGSQFEFSMMGYISRDPAKGRPHRGIMAGVYHPASGRFIDFPFTLPAGPYRKIADFEEDGMTFDEGFFISLKKSKMDGFAATEEESQAYTMDGYRGTALIPMSFKGMDFQWKDSGPQTSPNPTGLTSDRSALAFETGVENGSLRLQLTGRLPKAKSRTFQLYARPTLSFNMRLRLPVVK